MSALPLKQEYEDNKPVPQHRLRSGNIGKIAVSSVKRQAEEIHDAVKKRNISYGDFAFNVFTLMVVCFIVLVSFVGIIQFAGNVELQYEIARNQARLDKLASEKIDIRLSLDKLSELEAVENKASKMGLVYPVSHKVLKPAGFVKKSSAQDEAVSNQYKAVK